MPRGHHVEATELEELLFGHIPSTTFRSVGESKSCWNFPLPCSYSLGVQHLFYHPSLLLPPHKVIKWVGDKVCVLKGNWLQWIKESREGLLSAMSLFDSLPFIGNTQLESSPEQVFPDTPFPHVDFLRVSKFWTCKGDSLPRIIDNEQQLILNYARHSGNCFYIYYNYPKRWYCYCSHFIGE